MSKFVVVSDGDRWEGLYVDGKLVAEHHSIELQDLADAAGLDFDYRYADGDWVAKRGSFPKKLKDVKIDD